MTTSSAPRRQAPLKVDPAVDELISSGANFLGITKKDLVAEAVQFYLDARREEMRERMRTLMRQLDGTRAARVALLSGTEPRATRSGRRSRREGLSHSWKRARPTLRCLHHDLKIATPSADVPLDELNHPLLAKTHEQFSDPATPHERIAAIDDEVFFKVKIQRWRGAVWDRPSGCRRTELARCCRMAGGRCYHRLLRRIGSQRESRPIPPQRRECSVP